MLQSHPFFPSLFAWVQVALKHESHDRLAAFAELPQYFLGHEPLAGMIFLGVVMRTVDHDRADDAFTCDGCFCFRDVFCFVVGLSASATEHDMAVGIPQGLDDGGLAIGIDANEMVRRAGGKHGIDGDLQAAFRSVLESNRHGDTTGHFSMGLAFGGASADRCPADKIGHVLWTNWIQQLSAAGKTQLIDLEENRSGQLHSRRDVAGSIKPRVIDEALPSHRGPRLFEVGSHHDQESVAQGVGNRLQLGRIFIGRIGIMDGTGPDDDQQPVSVLAMEDPTNRFSGFNNEGSRLIGNGQFGLDGAR